jgi:flagellar biosynthesis protein FlhF
MSSHKFTAPSMSEALRLARKSLGGDALIISTRDLPDGVEIIAISSAKLQALSQGPNGHSTSHGTAPAATHPTDQIARDHHQSQINTESESKLLDEFADLKSMLATHLSQSAWDAISQDSPMRAEALKLLLQAGFSPDLSSSIASSVKLQGIRSRNLPNRLQRTLEEHLICADPQAIFDAGGVFAFVGPTGVGKTTVIAKIAARCALRYGREQIGLLTTDTFKIGAQEQLKIYGKIIGVPVIALRDSDDLTDKIKELSGRRIILLDTAGVNQRDVQMLEQAQLLEGGGATLKRILVMSCVTSLTTQEDVILMHSMANRKDSGPAFWGALITKTDEAAQLGPVVDCLIRHQLPLLFLSNGQRVPEDLNQADPQYLCYRALRPRALGTTLEIKDGQMPVLMADQLQYWTKRKASKRSRDRNAQSSQ